MNKQRRRALEQIVEQLRALSTEIETLRDEEQEYLDNMPESMQSGEKGEKAEGNVTCLDDDVRNRGGVRSNRRGGAMTANLNTLRQAANDTHRAWLKGVHALGLDPYSDDAEGKLVGKGKHKQPDELRKLFDAMEAARLDYAGKLEPKGGKK